MSKIKHNVLVIPAHIAALVEVRSMIQGVKRLKGNEVNFFIYTNFSFDEHYFDGLDCEVLNRISSVKTSNHKRVQNYYSKFKRLMARLLDDTKIGVFIQEKILLSIRSNRLKREKLEQCQKLKELVLKYEITSILTNTDRSLGYELSAYLAARELNLPFVVLSFAYSADIKSALKLRTNRIYLSNVEESWNTVKRDASYYRFYRPHEYDLLKKLRIPINNPWVLGGSFADLVLLDSDREKRRIVSLGGQESKYYVTGHSVHDELFQLLRDNRKKSSSVKNILISLPQYWEHGLTDKQNHFSVINELLNKLSNIKGAKVICSLHPKMHIDNYKYIGNIPNVELSVVPLKELIPDCDIFLCTYSTTSMWALICGKKVVLFDHIGLGYNDFLSEFNLPIYYENHSLVEYVADAIFASDNGHSTPLDCSSLSPFDGRCSDRLSRAILGIID